MNRGNAADPFEDDGARPDFADEPVETNCEGSSTAGTSTAEVAGQAGARDACNVDDLWLVSWSPAVPSTAAPRGWSEATRHLRAMDMELFEKLGIWRPTDKGLRRLLSTIQRRVPLEIEMALEKSLNDASVIDFADTEPCDEPAPEPTLQELYAELEHSIKHRLSYSTDVRQQIISHHQRHLLTDLRRTAQSAADPQKVALLLALTDLVAQERQFSLDMYIGTVGMTTARGIPYKDEPKAWTEQYNRLGKIIKLIEAIRK